MVGEEGGVGVEGGVGEVRLRVEGEECWDWLLQGDVNQGV